MAYHWKRWWQRQSSWQATEAALWSEVPRILGRLLFELGVEKNPECVKELPNQLKHDTIILFCRSRTRSGRASFCKSGSAEVPCLRT